LSILASLTGPADLRTLSQQELLRVCAEIRSTIIETVATTGGHLGSSLGVVELTVALHRILRSPTDRIVWDTGHQAYPHKLLTGRLEGFGTLRQLGGVGGFPRRSESPHDVMDGGHAGTGLSIGAGLAMARDQRGTEEQIAVVVGDAALMSGLSLEALNDIGQRQIRMLIVLNDNEMSISPTVGAFSRYLSRIKLSRTWRGSKRTYDDMVARLPIVGPTALELSRRLRKSVVNFAQPGQLFEDLGITYIGPVPGHDLKALDFTLSRALHQMEGPVIVHVRTRKGRGYRPAETDAIGFHGAALPPMTVVPATSAATAALALNGAASDGDATPSTAQAAAARKKPPNYTAVMAMELVRIGTEDSRVVAITAGMPTGTGLNRFAAAFPDRMYDVGIAEQHALTLATGLALGGLRPFVAIYSTFLQRAFDQTVHDVCQNDQPVVIGVDRAGLVGEDGTSHQGMFTVAAQRQLPNLVIASPKDEQELRRMLRTAFAQDHPFALHYPRDPGFDLPDVEPTTIAVGQAEVLSEGTQISLVGFGPIVARAVEAAGILREEGWSVGVVNGRFAKPLDADAITAAARGRQLVVTLEESVLNGGFGSAVLEALSAAGIAEPGIRSVPVLRIGLPGDRSPSSVSIPRRAGSRRAPPERLGATEPSHPPRPAAARTRPDRHSEPCPGAAACRAGARRQRRRRAARPEAG
jgi:1-deoxy-D-xylulose-5-phosphate synthase